MERYRQTMPFPGGRNQTVRPAQQPPVPVTRHPETLEGEAFPVAMAYVPWQYWTQVYPLEKALQRGTLFCQLDKPFTGRRNCGCN